MEKTYRVSVYAQAPGPESYIGNIMSFSQECDVIDGLVARWTGAKPRNNRFNSSFSDRYTQFLTKEGKMVYTNLPVIIEEE